MYYEEWRVRSVAVALYWAERNYFAQTGSYTEDLVRACHLEYIASFKRYPRTILSTPGTSGYRLSYKRVLRAVPHLLTEVMKCQMRGCAPRLELSHGTVHAESRC